MNSQALYAYTVINSHERNTTPCLSAENSDLNPAAGLATLADSALFDLSEMISDRDPAVLKELVEAFLSEATRQIQNMVRGIRENDMTLLFLPVHNLKSSSATFGAMRLARLIQMLEDVLSGSRDRDPQGQLVAEIEAEYALVSIAMQNALAQWRA